MNKNYSIPSLIFFLLLFFNSQKNIFSQSITTVVQYDGAQALGCCTVCGNDYWCINNFGGCGTNANSDTRNFFDPIPPGNIVTNIAVSYFSAGCYGNAITAIIGGNTFPVTYEANTGCLCSNNPCGLSASSSAAFPCGIPGYNYGGFNPIQLVTGADICMDRVELTISYAPASQSTPANTPGAISGSAAFCAGMPQVFSIAAVGNAASYVWSVPAGWTINAGQGSTSINVTPGSTAGNVCVIATNLCGNSAPSCLPVVLNTPSSAPASASASPASVCSSGSTNLTVNGGALGTGAVWNWYAGSCGGTFVGSGSSITVSASSSTTYFVSAVGSCNTTACTSVLFTVNPTPTANAGGTALLTCASPNAVLSGSGGGSYSWSGPGIISGGNTANPTVNQPGTYNLVVTVAGCASAPSAVTISQNITTPSATAASASGTNLTCATPNITLTGGPASGVSYSWSGPGIVSGGNTANPVVNQPGTYNLVVTDASNGCSNSSSPVSVTLTQDITVPVASAAAASGSVLDCNVTSLVLTGSPSSGVSYSWSGPGIVSGGNTASPTVNQPGTYNLVVTNVSNGCSNSLSPASVSVTQNNTPPSPALNAIGNATLSCAVTTVTLNATPASGFTYSWSGPGIVSGATTANPVVNQPGTYAVTATNSSSGCSNTVPATIVVAQNGVAPIATTNNATLTCANTSLVLNGGPATGVTYSWTGPGIVSGATTANPTVNQPGNYILTVTSATNGCSNTSTSIVSQDITNPSPVISSANGNTLTCNFTTLTLTGAPATGVTYSWSGPGIVSGATTANPVINLPGTYSLTTVNTINGCSNTLPVTVSISQNTTNPTAGITTATGGSSITCASPSLTLNATPTTGVSYTWSGPGIVSGATTANPVINQAGTYSLTVTDNVTGCTNIITSASSTISIFSNTLIPTAQITSSGTMSITCTNTVLTINATASTAGPNITYTWTTTNGTISANGNTNAPSITAAGDYTLTVLDVINGCSSTAVITVTSNVALPTGVDAGASALLPCNTGTISITGTSTSPNVSYLWEGPGNYTANTAVAGNVSVGGQYTLTVTDNITGCVSIDSVNIISQIVNAAFTSDVTDGVNPLSVNFTNQSAGAATFSWVFGDGNTSTATDPNNVFLNTGTYTVMLVAFNTANTCSDTAYSTIVVRDNFTLFIPNVFTPNGDGANDVFIIKSTGVVEMNCDIFNRWGEKMFSITSPQQSWDGLTAKGDLCPAATYFFILRVTGAGDQLVEKQGTINLFR